LSSGFNIFFFSDLAEAERDFDKLFDGAFVDLLLGAD